MRSLSSLRKLALVVALSLVAIAPPARAVEHHPMLGRLLGALKGANMNVTSDQAIPINAPVYLIRRIIFTNPSVSLTTAAGGVYTAASKGGYAVVASTQVFTALTSSSKYVDATLNTNTVTDNFNVATLYLSLTTAQGSAATCDVLIYGDAIGAVSSAGNGAGGGGSSIAFDASSSGNGSGTSVSWSHVCGSGSQRLLVVVIGVWSSNTGVVSGVTYNGAAMTKAINGTKTNNLRMEVWYLVNPASGSNTVAVTVADGSLGINCGGMSFTGADQSTPIEASAVASGDDTAPVVSATTVSANAWCASGYRANAGSSANTPTGYTERYDNAGDAAGGSSGPHASAGSVTHTSAMNASGPWQAAIVAIKAA